MDRLRKEVPIGRFSKKQRLAQVLIRLKDQVGAMADINAIMSRSGADIRQSVAYAMPGGSAVYSTFVWLKSPELTADNLAKNLEKSKFVFEVQAVEGVGAGIVDTLTFPISWQGDRVIVMRHDSLLEMLEGVQALLGTAGLSLFYEQGVALGTRTATEICRIVGADYARTNFAYGLKLLQAMGWGMVDVVRSAPDLSSATVRIVECAEAGNRKAEEAICHFMRGQLAGIFTVLAGAEMNAEETKCLATGDQFCEFEVRAKRA